MNIIHTLSDNKTLTHVFIVGFILAAVLFQVNNANAKSLAEDNVAISRIIGGVEANEGDWPWMVAILKTGSASVLYRQMCGGTLIDYQWVLTAAHCVTGSHGLEVLLGQINLDDANGEIISIVDVVIHPDYNAATNDSDLALLKMSRSTSIQPVRIMGDFNHHSEVGGEAIALGWGADKQFFGFDYFPSSLLQVDLPLVNNALCDSIWDINENMICTGTRHGTKSTCVGDSGGPLLVFDQASQTWQQLGITIFGSVICAQYGSYAVYTRVDKFQDFIDSTIESVIPGPHDFLTKCIHKYPDYFGIGVGAGYSCGNGYICQDTTGGVRADIKILATPINQKNETLWYFDYFSGWNSVAHSAIGYCN